MKFMNVKREKKNNLIEAFFFGAVFLAQIYYFRQSQVATEAQRKPTHTHTHAALRRCKQTKSHPLAVYKINNA